MAPHHALILGCGYTGERLALRLLADGHRVTGTTRSGERAAELREAGIEPHRLEVGEAESVRRLSALAPDVAFYLIPPLRTPGSPPGADAAGSAADRDVEVAGVVDALGRAPLDCFVYVSSTSVYGDRDGEWVDETAEPRPETSTARARLAAERTVLEKGWSRDARPRIARVSGIYGPGRTLSERIRDGRYHVVEGAEAVTNRIHVDDLAAGLHAVWTRGRDGRVYNMSDGHPLPSSDFARITAEHLGVELPSIDLEDARRRYSPTRLARKLGSKRVENRRLREELGVELRYPSVRDGLPAALREEEGRS